MDASDWDLSPQETTAYFRALAKECAETELVDEHTWADLEMERVFVRVNKCMAPPGAQYLYALLRRFQSSPEALRQNVATHHVFAGKPGPGAAVRQALRRLGYKESAEIPDVLCGPPPTVPAGHRLFYLVSAAAVLCPFGLLISPWFLLPSLALWILNIALHFAFYRTVVRHAPALTGLAALLGCVPGLVQALQGSGLPEEQELSSLREVARRVQKQISRTFLSRESNNDLTRLIVEYLNLFCLFELCSLCRAICAVNHERVGLMSLYRLVGRLDALQGLSTALTEFPVICAAESGPGRRFTLVDAYHPLLDNPVANSLDGAGNSLLFTGTNMAGKTTFIKALGINLLLAQTLGLCFARRAVFPPARLKTLIHREDTTLAGQSYFFYEATELLRMVEQTKRNGHEVWFVLDEVFRGTNTLERVAAAAAVLGHMTLHGVVIASTHDHELTTLLSSHFDSYHFSEVVEGQQARFDYRLRSGPCTSRNAIRLLTIAGFPQSVIDSATRVAQSIARGSVR
jgi:hypothetical protein